MTIDKGGFDKGYIRIDDVKMPRMEVSWENYKKRKLRSLSEIMNDVRKSIRKRVKRVRFIGRGRSTKVFGHAAKYVHWRIGEDEGYIVVWYCDKILRLYQVQLFFSRNEYQSFKTIMSKVLSSFKCHLEEGVHVWTVLDFSLKLPQDFKLVKRSFKIGNMMLTFKSRHSAVFVNRISMANVILEEMYDGDLRKVLEKEHLPIVRSEFKIPRFKYSRRLKDEAHEGLILSTSHRIGIFMPREYIVRTRIWVCGKANKIYAYTVVIRKTPGAERLRSRLETLLSSMCP